MRADRATSQDGLPGAPNRADLWLVAAMLLVLAVYTLSLALHGAEGIRALTDDWVGLLANTVPVGVCWRAIARARKARAQLLLTALAFLIHRQLRGLSLAVTLDGSVGALGAAAMLAAVLSPVFTAALTGPVTVQSVMTVATPGWT